MKKFDGYLILSDIDGTLTDMQYNVSDENKNAINYFIQNGGTFTIATGRHPEYLRDKGLVKLINGPAVLLNGVVIYDYSLNKILSKTPLNSDYTKILDYLDANVEYTHYDICTVNHGYRKEQFFRVNNPDEALKIVIVFEEESIAIKYQNKLKLLFGDKFNIMRSWKTGVEILNKEIGKGESINSLKDKIGTITKSIAIGDFENDVSMITLADISFAPKNSVKEILNLADYIVADNNHNAVAEMIKILDK